jgi:hypothetical protein
LSSFFKKIKVVFHVSSCWVKIRLYTENQIPRLPGTARIVITSDYNTTPRKVVLSCFGLLVGLWQ